MEYLKLQPGDQVDLGRRPDGLTRVHVFDKRSIQAVNAALAAGRPLLVRGEPGVGKSQLAAAAAQELDRKFIPFVVDARTESRDLLWKFDAIMRLADAQLVGALRADNARKDRDEDQDNDQNRVQQPSIQQQLAVANYLHPGPLWKAFDWDSACRQADRCKSIMPQHGDGDAKKGCVVLIDEIDKAESDVPNGLLGALGDGEFLPIDFDESIRMGTPSPLIVVTTNEERMLPDAFIRRCLVLALTLPDETDQDLIQHLISRGKAHFPTEAAPEILQHAAELVAIDRKAAKRQQITPLPGQAEFLDLVRAVINSNKNTLEDQQNLLQEISEFVLKKQPDH